jgi:hypothetical protein
LPHGDDCKGNRKYQVKYDMECDPSQDDLIILNQEDFNVNECENTIKMKSKHGINKKLIYIYLILFNKFSL